MGSRENVTSDRVKLFISRVDKDGDFKISKTELIEVLKDNQWKWFYNFLFLFFTFITSTKLLFTSSQINWFVFQNVCLLDWYDWYLSDWYKFVLSCLKLERGWMLGKVKEVVESKADNQQKK